MPLPLETKLLALAHASGIPDAALYRQPAGITLWSRQALWSLTVREASPRHLGQSPTWNVSLERPFGPPVSATVLTEWGVLTFLQKALSSPSGGPGA